MTTVWVALAGAAGAAARYGIGLAVGARSAAGAGYAAGRAMA